jgi:chaperone modulatory protein CbpM
MTTLDGILEGTPLDESTWIEVGDFCAWLSVERRWVASLVEAGVLEPRGAVPECWSFPASDLARVRATARLVHDLDVNLAGAAVILDLLEERRRLTRRLALLERLLEE